MSFSTILHTIRRLNPNNETTLVACSGGIDSVVLTYVMNKARIPIVLGHVAHNIRSVEETTKDIKIVQDLGTILDLPVRVVHLKDLVGRNLESRARTARYAAFKEMSADCAFVATAHHADDNLVTMIMQMARGSKPIGIRPKAEIFELNVIRPMLLVTKKSIQEIADRYKLDYNEDVTNTDERFVRNGLNQKVLPVIRQYYPGAAVTAAKRSFANV